VTDRALLLEVIKRLIVKHDEVADARQRWWLRWVIQELVKEMNS
jgi:hypothetical protein